MASQSAWNEPLWVGKELLVQVDALEPKEKLVIEKRFGLFDGRMYTLKEIAEQPPPGVAVARIDTLALAGAAR